MVEFSSKGRQTAEVSHSPLDPTLVATASADRPGGRHLEWVGAIGQGEIDPNLWFSELFLALVQQTWRAPVRLCKCFGNR